MVVAIIGILTGLTLSAVQRVRASAARLQCQNHLRQIGLGLANHHAAHGHLPPGVTLKEEPDTFLYMSWGVHLLPSIEQESVWRQSIEAARTRAYDFTRSPPHPFTTVIPIYGCPADERVGQTVLARGHLPVALGSYLGVAGTQHAQRDGSLFRDSHIRFTDMTDGTSNTLLVGERPPSPDLVFGWWYAGWGVDQWGTAETVLGVRERATPNSLEIPDCGRGFTRFQPGRLDNTCDVMHFWSLHAGGANFLLADGSVRFLTYSTDPLMPALATRAGGEVASVPD